MPSYADSHNGAPNIELLDRTLDLLENNPQLHNQRAWITVDDRVEPPPTLIDPKDAPCGTRGCLAGWATVLSGAEINWHQNLDGIWECRSIEAPDGEIWYSISEYARFALGVSGYVADSLFQASNTLETLRRIRNKLAAQKERKPNDDRPHPTDRPEHRAAG